MTRFGPTGMPDAVSGEGVKRSCQMPEYVRRLGLSAFEYAGGHGLRVSARMAQDMAESAAANDVSISVHAPYFVNLATEEFDKQQSAVGYLLDAARLAGMMGGERVVFHPGSAKHGRSAAMARAKYLLKTVLRRMDDAGLGHVHLCPETMGKYTLLGQLDEVLELCQLDERLIPTLDLGHMNALAQGGLRAPAAFDSIFEYCIRTLGRERMQNFHMHFSHIEYGATGETRHRCFNDDSGFGPDFAHVAQSLVKYELTPIVICESAGTQDVDAVAMRDTYLAALSDAEKR